MTVSDGRRSRLTGTSSSTLIEAPECAKLACVFFEHRSALVPYECSGAARFRATPLSPCLTQLRANSHLTSFPLYVRANSGLLLPVFNAPRYPKAAAWLENLGAVNRPWK